jgi:isopentenyldiphosphate isomerase
MSFLDRIAECNQFDAAHFRPFFVAGHQLGWVRPAFMNALAEYSDVFVVKEDSVTLQPRLDSFEARSAAVAPVMQALAERGVIAGWRNELYPATTSFRAQPLLQLERAAVAYLGLRTFGVHLNGFVRKHDGIHLWVPRRARLKPTYPGLLDNTVAGGQPIGVGLHANVVKECHEEANIPAELAQNARAVGVITYCAEVPEGLAPDAQFCFDLELPEDFVPSNTDGEVDEFYLWPIERVTELVRDTREFKPNCNLVIIQFLMRHGLLPPDHPDYVALAQGLVAPIALPDVSRS